MALTLSVAAAQAQGAALASHAGADPLVEIRTGAPSLAASGTLLATVAVAGSLTSTGGVLTGQVPTTPIQPVASGAGGHFRLTQAGGTAVLAGTLTATGGGGDLTFGSVNFEPGVEVVLDTITITMPTS